MDTAVELFSYYAKSHSNRKLVLNELIDLLANDNYGAREGILLHAIEYLSEPEMRNLMQIFSDKSDADPKDHRSWRWTVQSIAEQLRDGPLYEKLVRDSMDGKANSAQIVRIAGVYFSADQIERAQALIDTVSEKETFSAHERSDLQKKIYEKTGNKFALVNLLHQRLLESISLRALDELVIGAGPVTRETYLNEVKTKIEADPKWSSTAAEFLIDIKDSESLDQYVKKYALQLDEQFYGSLAKVAQFLEAEKKYLSASLAYRALTADILNRGKSKAYGHGARYLQDLEKLQNAISDWEQFESHEVFVSQLRIKHRLKKSFWAQVNND